MLTFSRTLAIQLEWSMNVSNVLINTVAQLIQTNPNDRDCPFSAFRTGGYIARASWKDCSISGDQTPSASLAMSTGLFAELPSSTELAISKSSWSEILAVFGDRLKKRILAGRNLPVVFIVVK